MAFQISSTAFCFPQRLSPFFNRFPIFLDGFLLSKKSKKIYPRWQEYERSLFELRISSHLLSERRNSLYNVYISPTQSSKSFQEGLNWMEDLNFCQKPT
jgi:hypothetical protein